MKNFLTSKTIWFNVIAGALGVFINSVEGATILDPTVQLLIVTLGNFGLRWITTQGVSLTGK